MTLYGFKKYIKITGYGLLINQYPLFLVEIWPKCSFVTLIPGLLLVTGRPVLFEDDDVVGLAAPFKDGGRNVEGLGSIL
jgi:hypothetical protein